VKITLDWRELTAEKGRAAKMKPELRAGSWKIVRAGAFSLERQVKAPPPLGMPVDTYHARNNWAHGPAGIWEEDEGNLEIVEGTTVVYVARLNEGWSTQSPAGFIDAAALKTEVEINTAIDRLLGETL
jgi:hypothetical protein